MKNKFVVIKWIHFSKWGRYDFNRLYVRGMTSFKRSCLEDARCQALNMYTWNMYAAHNHPTCSGKELASGSRHWLLQVQFIEAWHQIVKFSLNAKHSFISGFICVQQMYYFSTKETTAKSQRTPKPVLYAALNGWWKIIHMYESMYELWIL